MRYFTEIESYEITDKAKENINSIFIEEMKKSILNLEPKENSQLFLFYSIGNETKMLHFQALTLVKEINIELKLSKKFENVALKFVFADYLGMREFVETEVEYGLSHAEFVVVETNLKKACKEYLKVMEEFNGKRDTYYISENEKD